VAAETDLQFDGWRVNRVSGEISREGRVSRLPQQPLRILVQLYDHAGEIVTREQLVKILWPAGVVDFDNGLNVAVRKLRVALDDVADTPRYIETIPKVGYRFLARPGEAAAAPPSAGAAPVPAEASAPAEIKPSRVHHWVLLGATVVALAGVFWWTSVHDSATAESRHVPSLRAQELYLKGIQERARRDVNPTKQALAYFEAALKEDPDYAEAWSAYGFTIAGTVMRQMNPPGEAVPKARAAAERSLALEPDNVEGRVLMVHLLMDHEKNFPAAGEALEHAREVGQGSAHFWHYSAMWHGQMGRVDQALADMRRARGLEPMTLLFTANHAFILVNARRYEEAIELLRPQVDANPGFVLARSILGRALAATGDLHGARQQLEARPEIGLMQADLALVYLKLGLRDEALKELQRIEDNGRKGFGTAYDEAVILTAMGDLDQGCERLERALSDGSVLINWMRLDPRMDALRGRKCFADVERRLYGE
jgi:DNA-binding winged helix-turn-helix (wHTH) protein/tetratricopeptide (TPR) repeat protein